MFFVLYRGMECYFPWFNHKRMTAGREGFVTFLPRYFLWAVLGRLGLARLGLQSRLYAWCDTTTGLIVVLQVACHRFWGLSLFNAVAGILSAFSSVKSCSGDFYAWMHFIFFFTQCYFFITKYTMINYVLNRFLQLKLIFFFKCSLCCIFLKSLLFPDQNLVPLIPKHSRNVHKDVTTFQNTPALFRSNRAFGWAWPEGRGRLRGRVLDPLGDLRACPIVTAGPGNVSHRKFVIADVTK